MFEAKTSENETHEIPIIESEWRECPSCDCRMYLVQNKSEYVCEHCSYREDN